jgi:hypothetical protein
LVKICSAAFMIESSNRTGTPFDVLAIEQSLRAAVPEAVFAAPRVVRRIIRLDLDLPLLWARLPHREGIPLSPARLLELADDVWTLPPDLPDTILLLARPDSERFAGGGEEGLLREYWRLLYHGCLDIAARRAVAERGRSGREFRTLVEEVGETEFEEATAVLAREGLLRDPGNAREALAEFVAVVLEFEAFSPELMPIWFPGIEDPAALADRFAAWVDADAILERTRPAGLRDGPPPAAAPAPPPRASTGLAGALTGRLSRQTAVFLRSRAAAAARRGNDVRAALLQWRLEQFAGNDAEARSRAARLLEERLAALGERLKRAIGLGNATAAGLRRLLAGLVDLAAGSAWSQPARLLYDLQKICVDSERESYRTQLLSWAVTLGRVPLVRPLPNQRTALVHRHVATAFRRLVTLGLPPDLAEPAAAILGPGLDATEATLRGRLGPPVRAALADAGLVAPTLVEEAAFDKLADDLLDDLANRGFESFGNVRDAVSRSQVKLPDLAGLGELVGGDPLLRADRNLAAALDGGYRRAPLYLLAMQRLSAVAFGLPLGRWITVNLLLPFGGAWVLWKGLEHIVEPLTHYSLGEPVHIYSRTAVLVTGVAAWLLMHVPDLRAAVLAGLETLGGLAHMALVVLPRRLLRLPAVEQFFKSRPVRLFRRYAWSPLVASLVVWLLLPHGGTWLSRSNRWLPGLLFAASAAALNSTLGRAVQERLLEAVGRALYQLHVHLIIGLFTWILDTFRRAMDFVEGMLYAVDEQLRFHADESPAALGVKAVLTTLWSGIDWLVRFCVTLLIEPQLNPIKHFPVVTVSHKLLVPMIPMAAANLAAATGMRKRLALTTVTFISTAIPGVFGFLAWELKENWRLYAANRPRLLVPVRVGRHGESMRRLLVPGFHSGTIPKLFARLRRQRKGRGTARVGAASRAEEQLVELGHDVAAVVDDECLGLLRRTRLLGDVAIEVAGVRLATNRVVLDLAADQLGPEPLRLEWVQGGPTLSRRIAASGWLDRLSADRQRLVQLALAGLDCLCGVDFVSREADGIVESLPVEPIEWTAWRDAWERERAAG